MKYFSFGFLVTPKIIWWPNFPISQFVVSYFFIHAILVKYCPFSPIWECDGTKIRFLLYQSKLWRENGPTIRKQKKPHSQKTSEIDKVIMIFLMANISSIKYYLTVDIMIYLINYLFRFTSYSFSHWWYLMPVLLIREEWMVH